MTARRSAIDRFLRLGSPKPVAGFAPPPRELAPGLWALDRRLRMPGGPLLPARTTIARLESGSLVVISPPPAEAGGLDALDRLGRVEFVVAPNPFHYLYAAAFLARFPKARFYAAPGLAERIPGLPAGETLSDRPPDEWAAEIDQVVLGPVRGNSEVLFYHRPSGTLVLTDLAFHMVNLERAFDRVAWRLAGVPRGFGPSRSARLVLLRDRAAASRTLERVVQWPFQRVVVAHGETLEADAASEFERAFSDYLSR